MTHDEFLREKKLKSKIRAIMLRVNVTLFKLHSFPFFLPTVSMVHVVELKKKIVN